MSKEWYSVRDLKGLPGLPGTTATIRNHSKRAGWRARLVQGDHNTTEFHISSLPEATREHLGDFNTYDQIEQSDQSDQSDQEITQTKPVAANKQHPAQSYIDDQQQYRVEALKRQAWQDSR